jgi:hypothetical protein
MLGDDKLASLQSGNSHSQWYMISYDYYHAFIKKKKRRGRKLKTDKKCWLLVNVLKNKCVQHLHPLESILLSLCYHLYTNSTLTDQCIITIVLSSSCCDQHYKSVPHALQTVLVKRQCMSARRLVYYFSAHCSILVVTNAIDQDFIPEEHYY